MFLCVFVSVDFVRGVHAQEQSMVFFYTKECDRSTVSIFAFLSAYISCAYWNCSHTALSIARQPHIFS